MFDFFLPSLTLENSLFDEAVTTQNTPQQRGKNKKAAIYDPEALLEIALPDESTTILLIRMPLRSQFGK